MEAGVHTRSVSDNLAEVDAAVKWADAIARAAGLPKSVCDDLQVCLEEALANLVMHGRAAGDKRIALELTPGAGECVARISDRCAPFDAAAAPLPQMDLDHPGGAGLR